MYSGGFFNAIFKRKNIKATTIYKLTTTCIPTNIVKYVDSFNRPVTQ